MSLSSLTSGVWRLTPVQRTLIAGFLAAAIASASSLDDGAMVLVIRATLWFTLIALVELTFEAVRGAPLDRRAFIAYLPMASATLALFLAQATADHVTRSGPLSTFFGTAVSLLGLLLVSLVVETRRVTTKDQWLHALRGWWVGFIILGILYALLGLAPGHSRKSEQSDYAMVWAGLVGAVAALSVVMWRDSPQRPAVAVEREAVGPPRTPETTLATSATSTSTRTPLRSTRAIQRAARR
jgi:hypothetical protein